MNEPMPAQRGGGTTVITYVVTQRTTAAPENVNAVIDQFKRGLDLDYGRTVHADAVSVVPT